ncbi:hypothetical protein GCM10010207_74640 [Streptomyces atratus]|nr:hypothetical protein GCM10010207_74640 [Streptomyces atratus]
MPTLEKIRPVTGAPCWVNLMAQDLRAAQSFYTDVMDWMFRESILGSNFSVALACGEPVAGIGCCSAGGPPADWAPYFAVKNADETAVRIGERGATLAVGPLPLGEDRVGIAADRDGAVFGFWEGPGLFWSVGRGSAPARLDLQTRDAFEATIFYAEIFDWAQPPGGCTVDYAQDHVLIQAVGHTVATLRGGGIDPDPRIRPVDRGLPCPEQQAGRGGRRCCQGRILTGSLTRRCLKRRLRHPRLRWRPLHCVRHLTTATRRWRKGEERRQACIPYASPRPHPWAGRSSRALAKAVARAGSEPACRGQRTGLPSLSSGYRAQPAVVRCVSVCGHTRAA